MREETNESRHSVSDSEGRFAFAELPAGNPQGLKLPLAPMLRRAMDNGLVTATVHTGPWTDVGTPQRLAQLNAT